MKKINLETIILIIAKKIGVDGKEININFRFIGALFGASIFFLITNLGVWLSGGLYEFTLGGLITCFTLALPFFGYTAISTVIFSAIIEAGYGLCKNNIKTLNN